MPAGVLTAVVHVVLGVLLGRWVGGIAGLLAGALVGLLLGVPFGWAVAAARVYRADPKGILLFLVDHTWSLPNTLVGTLHLAVHLVLRHRLDRTTSRHSGRVDIMEGLLPGYATTVGTVCAGSNPRIQRHEDMHILQARLLGPLYLPLVLANYALFTLVPVWLLWHDHATAPINRVSRYFEVGVYPHVWHEAIAYRVQGRPPH